MNRLGLRERDRVASLVEGTSIDVAARMTGVAKHSILKLLKGIGCACAEYHNRIARNVNVRRDETWAFSPHDANVMRRFTRLTK